MHGLGLVSSTLVDLIFHPIALFQGRDLLWALVAPPFLTVFLFTGIYTLAVTLQMFIAVLESFITEVSVSSEPGKVIVTKKRRNNTKRLEFLADGIQSVGIGMGSVAINYGGTKVPLMWGDDQTTRDRIHKVVASAGAPITTSGWVERKSPANLEDQTA
jgi:hypothetical protein